MVRSYMPFSAFATFISRPTILGKQRQGTAIGACELRLRAAGYATGYIGKWHLSGVPRDRFIPPEERLGFEEWKAAECIHSYDHSYYDDEQNERHWFPGFESEGQADLAIDFVERKERNRRTNGTPWALVLSWGPPHAPYDVVPQRHAGLFSPADIRLRPNVPERVLRCDGSGEYTGTDQMRAVLAGYCAQISYLDEQFGRIMDSLDALGAARDTVVIYTSDHGDMLGSQGLQKKQLPHDESVLVPFLIRWPGRLEPGVRPTPMGLVDLAPTIAGFAGGGFTAADGVDRGRLLRRGEAEEEGQDDPAVLIYNLVPCHQAADRGETRGWYGIRTRRYTYAVWDDGEPFCLYDNDVDPFQTANLCGPETRRGQCGSVATRLRSRLEAQLGRAGASIEPWQELIPRLGLRDAWNASQEYFGRPLLLDGCAGRSRMLR